jgi:hypothetical protein
VSFGRAGQEEGSAGSSSRAGIGRRCRWRALAGGRGGWLGKEAARGAGQVDDHMWIFLGRVRIGQTPVAYHYRYMIEASIIF